MMRNTGIVISRETLIERVWGFDFLGDTNRVDVYIRRVRQKIEVDPTMRARQVEPARQLGVPVLEQAAPRCPELETRKPGVCGAF